MTTPAPKRIGALRVLFADRSFAVPSALIARLALRTVPRGTRGNTEKDFGAIGAAPVHRFANCIARTPLIADAFGLRTDSTATRVKFGAVTGLPVFAIAVVATLALGKLIATGGGSSHKQYSQVNSQPALPHVKTHSQLSSYERS